MKGVREFDISSVKQIGMSGSPAFTADTSLDTTSGDNATLTGTISQLQIVVQPLQDLTQDLMMN